MYYANYLVDSRYEETVGLSDQLILTSVTNPPVASPSHYLSTLPLMTASTPNRMTNALVSQHSTQYANGVTKYG